MREKADCSDPPNKCSRPTKRITPRLGHSHRKDASVRASSRPRPELPASLVDQRRGRYPRYERQNRYDRQSHQNHHGLLQPTTAAHLLQRATFSRPA
jgi:hypothetical protein